MRRPAVSIFVPCLNEGPRLEGAIDTICMACVDLSFEIIVANDGSTDNTLERMYAAQQAHPEVKITILNSKVNRGLGYFYLAAAYVASGHYFIFIPGDNVVPIATIRNVLALRGQADIVIPFMGDLDPRPPWRQRLSRAFTALVNFLGGHSIKYYNTCVLHRRDHVRSIPNLSRSPAYQAELISYLVGGGASYVEIKVGMNDLVKSTTVRFANVFPVFVALARIALRRLQRSFGAAPTAQSVQVEGNVARENHQTKF